MTQFHCDQFMSFEIDEVSVEFFGDDQSVWNRNSSRGLVLLARFLYALVNVRGAQEAIAKRGTCAQLA